MAQVRPIIALDIDGVLNPCHRDAPALSPDWKFEPMALGLKVFHLHLSKEMGQAIRDLGDVHWLTTWIKGGDQANPEIAPKLGWPPMPLIEIVEKPYRMSESGMKWKRTSMEAFLQQPGPPVIWIDDCMDDFFDLDEDGPGSKFDPHYRLFTICPDESVGLLRSHLDVAKEWLAARVTPPGSGPGPEPQP